MIGQNRVEYAIDVRVALAAQFPNSAFDVFDQRFARLRIPQLQLFD